MFRFLKFLTLASVIGAAGYWLGTHQFIVFSTFNKGLELLPASLRPVMTMAATPKPASGPAIYYRDPDGKAAWSLEPRKAADGRDFVAVLASEDLNVNPEEIASSAPTATAEAARKIKFYRNPMGLPDVSPMPKKDSMGMDYIPVYDGEETDDGSVKLSPGKLQRTGVRSEPVGMHRFTTPIRAPGTIQVDERRQSVVSLRFEGWIDKVENVTTGAVIRKGQPLFKVYGPELSAAAAQYVSILGSPNESASAASKGARRRLENLGVPDTVITELARTREIPLTLSWSAPRDGIITERNVSDGMRSMPGDALFRLADVSVVWALADIAERDLSMVRVGQQATVRPRGYPGRSFRGNIAVIYPAINRETRTVRVRIELANPDLALMPEMYTDVEIASGSDAPMLAVPENAVVDSGEKQIVIVDKGDGRFEPRAVRTGQRGVGMVEIREGLSDGERIVTSANFLIDAESNLKAALQGLTSSAPASSGDAK
jgi:Cu(I)/Ag(I) efflux system membrane fusion protein